MKLTRHVAIASFAFVPLVLTASLSGQPPTKEANSLEQEIRKIDGAENIAVLAKDVPTIEKFWAEDFVVNAPNNQILKGRENAIKLVKDGIERTVDKHATLAADAGH